MSKLKVGDKLVVASQQGLLGYTFEKGKEFTILKAMDEEGWTENLYETEDGWVVDANGVEITLHNLEVVLKKVTPKMTRTELTEVAKVQAKAFAEMAKRLVALEKQVEELTAKPKLKGSDLTRQMLKDGAGSVECYVDDNGDKEAIDDAFVSTINEFYDGVFRSAEGCPWRYAVPVDSIGEKK